MAHKGLQKSPRDSEMSDGGLNATNLGGRSMAAPGSTLESDMSGFMHKGGASKGGAGAQSPTADKVAAEAAEKGRISTAGQARGGPQQMSDAVATPKSGTGAAKGRGKTGGSL